MDWRARYADKLTTADEAVQVIANGAVVGLPFNGSIPFCLLHALAARAPGLRGVRVNQILSDFMNPDWPWYDPAQQDSVCYATGFVGPAARAAVDRKTADVWPMATSLVGQWLEADRANPALESDVFLVKLSPPDAHGNCSFGYALWLVRDQVANAKHVIAEIDESMIRTFGDNHVHVSQIDQLVETPEAPAGGEAFPSWGFPIPEAEHAAIEVMGELTAAELVRDRDTIFLGGGSPSFALAAFLGNREDLGFHSEVMPGAVIPLVANGVINGKHKTINPGKAVATIFAPARPEDLETVHLNPAYELRDMTYTNNPLTIAAHDNMVAVNTALFTDLTGQVASESIGPRMLSGTGGQLEFIIGAMLSRGGRSIHMLQSTYQLANGEVKSRLVPALPPNQVVTVPRTFVDYVVTEYGWVNLQGKTQRERAEALIGIAHPDFRPELRKAARKLFWAD